MRDFEKVRSKEGFAAGQADMLESHLDGCVNDLDQLGFGEVVWTGSPTAIAGRATVEATFVTLIRDGNTQVVDLSAKWIKKSGGHGLRWGCVWYKTHNPR